MQKRLLFAVMDWGLGHATRSAPVIHAVKSHGVEIEIASSGKALAYLNQRFQGLVFHELPDKSIRYSKKGARKALIGRALIQSTINSKQNEFIRRLVSRRGFTHIISDNVYGAHGSGISSALITHQLSIKTPLGEGVINRKIAAWINKFTEVWVPDDSKRSLSGDLGKNLDITIPVYPIGLLSRFSKFNPQVKKYKIAMILGGPEPQRSILEKKLLELTTGIPGKKILFQGKTHSEQRTIGDLKIMPFGDGKTLAEVMGHSELIIGRSGYSTISDLVSTESKGLLIPTPGQTEQEYLAEHLKHWSAFSICSQRELSENCISKVLVSDGHSMPEIPRFTGDNIVLRNFLGVPSGFSQSKRENGTLSDLTPNA